MNKMYRNIVMFAVFLFGAKAASEGESCIKNGVSAVCRNIENCPSAISDIKNRRHPQICGYEGTDPVVCCPDVVQPVATTPPPSSRPSTTPYVPEVYEYYDANTPKGQRCRPLPPSRTAPKTGQKAWDKCIEYQEQLVYPCVKSNSLAASTDYSRVDRCGHTADQLIIGGVDAAKKEFPHMVLLGYGDTADTSEWKCGGSLISERFILTAGHCTSDRDGGIVSYAIIGALKRSDQVDSSQLYKIGEIHKHPRYKSPSKYNDIALLKTEKQMALDQFTVPACLDVGDALDEKSLATGWGSVKYRGPNADRLQKVTLTKFLNKECAAQFPSSRNLEFGFDANTQVCYGDRTMSKDTCQGDSGGPLQVKNKRIQCMYTIVGVTSFGGACGFVGEPGIYTRVAPYLPWIESVVWPSP